MRQDFPGIISGNRGKGAQQIQVKASAFFVVSARIATSYNCGLKNVIAGRLGNVQSQNHAIAPAVASDVNLARNGNWIAKNGGITPVGLAMALKGNGNSPDLASQTQLTLSILSIPCSFLHATTAAVAENILSILQIGFDRDCCRKPTEVISAECCSSRKMKD